MIDVNFFLGLPKDFYGICKIYPPTVKDVIQNEKSLQYYKLLTQSQEEIEDLIDDHKDTMKFDFLPNPLEFILINSYHNDSYQTLIKESFQFFIHEAVELDFEHKGIVINQTTINNDLFFVFQNVLRMAMGDSILDPYDYNMNPIVKNIKKKVRKAKKKTTKGISLTTTLIALCNMNYGLTPLTIINLSYGAIGPLTKIYQQKEKYDIDIRSLMAGADSKKVKPKYWIYEDESNGILVPENLMH